jgi:hypothetical protein
VVAQVKGIKKQCGRATLLLSKTISFSNLGNKNKMKRRGYIVKEIFQLGRQLLESSACRQWFSNNQKKKKKTNVLHRS